jgi:hypothetical protein
MNMLDLCLQAVDELGDNRLAAKQVCNKFRRENPEEVAQCLLTLLDEYEYEEFVGYALKELDSMPINYFDSILDFDTKLADLY